MSKNQKTIILSSHMHHKTLWRCHPSQTGQDDLQKIATTICSGTNI
jgi:hypothetical protein